MNKRNMVQGLVYGYIGFAVIMLVVIGDIMLTELTKTEIIYEYTVEDNRIEFKGQDLVVLTNVSGNIVLLEDDKLEGFVPGDIVNVVMVDDKVVRVEAIE